MRWDSTEDFFRTCSVCGEALGGDGRHVGCAAIKQEENKNKKRVPARKKLRLKDEIFLTAMARGDY